MPVGVVQCPQPNLQNLIVLFQYVQRLFDETGCCEFPIILAVKDEFRAHFLVGFVDSGNLPDPLTRGEPCKRQIVILPCEMLILRSVAIFENHILADWERIVSQKAVESHFQQILPPAARDYDRNVARMLDRGAV